MAKSKAETGAAQAPEAGSDLMVRRLAQSVGQKVVADLCERTDKRACCLGRHLRHQKTSHCTQRQKVNLPIALLLD